MRAGSQCSLVGVETRHTTLARGNRDAASCKPRVRPTARTKAASLNYMEAIMPKTTFTPYSRIGDRDLLSVNPDVPLYDALLQAKTHLGVSESCIEQSSNDEGLLFGAVHHVQTAQAIIQSLLSDIRRTRKDGE